MPLCGAKEIFMKKIACSILIITISVALAACSPVSLEVEETTFGNSVHNTVFSLSIWAENNKYNTTEPVNCFASVMYYGQENITIYHKTPLVKLQITGDSEPINYTYVDTSDSTVFVPGQEIVFPFQKSGGWEQHSDHENLKTIFDEKIYGNEERCFPVGEYTLTVEMEYWTDEGNVTGTTQTLSESVTVTVEQ